MKINLVRPLFILIISCFISNICYSQKSDSISNRFIIILDIQEYYTKGEIPEGSSQKLIDSVNYIIDNVNSSQIIYLKRIHKVLNISTSFPFAYISFDSLAMRFDNRLNIVNKNIFSREKSSAFSMKELKGFLKEKKAKEIVIIGLLAEEFILKSLIDGEKLSYDMYVIPEAIIGKSEKSKDKAIQKLAKKGVETISIRRIISEKKVGLIK